MKPTKSLDAGYANDVRVCVVSCAFTGESVDVFCLEIPSLHDDDRDGFRRGLIA